MTPAAKPGPRRGRFSRLRDGEHDAPVRVRSPLICNKQTADRIAAGELTQHRLHAPRDLDADCRFRVGEVYGVSFMAASWHLGYRRDKPTKPRRKAERVCDIRIVKVSRALLGDATDEDARAEGFHDRDALLEHWREKHDLKRPERKAVWVVVFELEKWQRARMMAQDSSHGYTESPEHAVPSDKSENVDPALLRDRWETDAEGRWREANVDKLRSLNQRVRRVTSQVGAGKLAADDAAPQLAVIEEAIEEIERKLGAAA